MLLNYNQNKAYFDIKIYFKDHIISSQKIRFQISYYRFHSILSSRSTKGIINQQFYMKLFTICETARIASVFASVSALCVCVNEKTLENLLQVDCLPVDLNYYFPKQFVGNYNIITIAICDKYI